MPGVNGYGGYGAYGGREDPYGARGRVDDPYSREPTYQSRAAAEPFREPEYGYHTRAPDHRNGYSHPRNGHSRNDRSLPEPVVTRNPPPREEPPRMDPRGPPPRNEDPYSRGRGADPPPADMSGGGYELDHLATFTVGPKQGLLSPEDGIRKLRQMELTTGIWTMRVRLVVEQQDLIIIDRQTKEEMERFPLHLVNEPTAVTNSNMRDVYNNIVLFTVMEDTYRRAPTEMHIFQCSGRPAQEVADEVKFAKTRAASSRGRPGPGPRDPYGDMGTRGREHEERAGHSDPPESPHIDPRVMEGWDPNARNRPSQMIQGATFGRDDESVLSDRTDKDVQLLNHCFDDIEKFVGRLQQAAESFKELERRRRSRAPKGQKNGRGMGDGMLSMRARPPPAKDFIDIFQKFKLAFILLAKLKDHIHDPNAPELVHFLFTPLSLVVEASKDPRRGTPDLAARVIAPLLSVDAKELLNNCLTSKEAELWHSLGDAWTLCREQWKGYVPAYYPKFSNGFSVPPGWLEHSEPSIMGDSREPRMDPRTDEPYRDDYPPRRDRERYIDDNFILAKPGGETRRSSPPPSSRSHDHHSGQGAYSQHPSHPMSYDRERDRDRQRDDDLAFEREMAERRRREEIDNRRPQEPPPRGAYVDEPAPRRGGSRRERTWDDEQDDFIRELKQRGAKIIEVMRDKQGKNQKELSVKKGEILEVLDDSRQWWKCRNSQGQSGHAPYTIMQEYTGGEGMINREGADAVEASYHNTAPASPVLSPRPPSPPYLPPAPHLQPPPPPGDWHSAGHSPPRASANVEDNYDRRSFRSDSSWEDKVIPQPPKFELHDELKKRMSIGNLTPQRTKSQRRAEVAFIDNQSNPLEVQDWLLSKGFSPRVRQQLRGKSGRELFNLSRNTLEGLAGEEEGGRLYSNLLIQKNMTGYQTRRTTELQAILQQRRQKADSDEQSALVDSADQPPSRSNGVYQNHEQLGYDSQQYSNSAL